MANRHPAIEDVIKYFDFSHLPEHLQPVSQQFFVLAHQIAAGPQVPQTTIALQKLLESKDAAVRAAL